MKCFKTLICIMLVAVVFESCGRHSSKKEDDDSVPGMSLEDYQANRTFFMLSDNDLPKSVNLEQKIDKLSYQNLRLLRAYVYAIHGHWFMEGDLNTFFFNHTKWYYDTCVKAHYPKMNDDQMEWELSAYGKEYSKLCDDDYEKTYLLVKLSPEEKKFVEAIDKRMSELRSKGKVTSPDDVQILNSLLAINMYQVNDPSPRLLRMLAQYNVAMEKSNYEQLFNVYENNDYLVMPNFVTTDVMLQLYHMYFSYVLKSLEGDVMRKSLTQAFRDLYFRSASMAMDGDEKASWNAAFFSVGLRLLGENPDQYAAERHIDVDMALGEYRSIANTEYSHVMAAKDELSPLFATVTQFPYSLFKPRGHYTRKESARQYFRAMMWLQRGCLMRNKPAQLRQAISMAQLLNATPSARKQLDNINKALTFLMGNPDNVSIMELANHLDMMNMNGNLTDADVREVDGWLKEMFKKRNKIKPKVKIEESDPMNLMPQRYMFDSEVLGTMYDPEANAPRAYPTGLDVMDILGVKTAKNILDTCYNKRCPWNNYTKERAELAKRLKGNVDWDGTMYNKWMKTLVALQKPDKSQPGFMNTKLWKVKNLNSALASWALLKHDAVLYGEQPIAAECGGGGDLPDPHYYGYVEPNVPFWQQLHECMTLCSKMLTQTGFMTSDLKAKTEDIQSWVDFMLRVSKEELAGKRLSESDYGKIVHIGGMLEYITLSVLDPELNLYNWSYVKGADRSVAQIVDVFTRNVPNCDKQGILYEATGNANIIYVIVEMNGEYYLTRGATYSYYEFVRPLGDRLTDEQWQQMLLDGKAPAVPDWFAPWLLEDKQVDMDQRFCYGTGC